MINAYLQHEDEQEEIIMDVSEFTGSSGKYLNVKIVQDKGYELKPLEIEKVEVMTFDSGDRALTAHFVEIDEVLRLNKTNARTLASKYGDESDKWLGKKVSLVIVKTNLDNKDGIQVKIVEDSGQ